LKAKQFNNDNDEIPRMKSLARSLIARIKENLSEFEEKSIKPSQEVARPTREKMEETITKLEESIQQMPERANQFAKSMCRLEIVFPEMEALALRHDLNEIANKLKVHQNSLEDDAYFFATDLLKLGEDFAIEVQSFMQEIMILDFQTWLEIREANLKKIRNFRHECKNIQKQAAELLTKQKVSSGALKVLQEDMHLAFNSRSVFASLWKKISEAFTKSNSFDDREVLLSCPEEMIKAVDAFSSVMDSFESFFRLSESSLESICQDETIPLEFARHHFDMIATRANNISRNCSTFIGALVDPKTDILALESMQRRMQRNSVPMA